MSQTLNSLNNELLIAQHKIFTWRCASTIESWDELDKLIDDADEIRLKIERIKKLKRIGDEELL